MGGIDAARTSRADQGPSGGTFGDISGRIEELREAANELQTAYENDTQVVALAARAGSIRDFAASLASALYDIDNALAQLV